MLPEDAFVSFINALLPLPSKRLHQGLMQTLQLHGQKMQLDMII